MWSAYLPSPCSLVAEVAHSVVSIFVLAWAVRFAVEDGASVATAADSVMSAACPAAVGCTCEASASRTTTRRSSVC